MRSALLLVGDELLGGVVADVNLAMVAHALASRGAPLEAVEIVPDDRALIAAACRRLAPGRDLLVVTGGLGPTADDVTREGLADALGVGLTVDEPRRRALAARLAARGLDAGESASRQATFPEGTQAIDNPVGSAPGIRARLGTCTVWCVPGVPIEAREMVGALVAALPGWGVGRSGERMVATAGLSEVRVATRLAEGGFAPPAGVRLGFLPSPGGVRLRLAAPDGAPDPALDEAVATIRGLLRGDVLPEGSLEASVVAELAAAGLTLATAESCTGGGIGARITDVPGSSSVYLGGTVAYANRTKVERLGVDPGLLEAHGAVSAPVARAMAAGARQRFGADLAVAVTGVAGPGGGTPDKPVGTVWIATADAVAADAVEFRYPGPREMVRERTVRKALELVWRRVRDVR